MDLDLLDYAYFDNYNYSKYTDEEKYMIDEKMDIILLSYFIILVIISFIILYEDKLMVLLNKINKIIYLNKLKNIKNYDPLDVCSICLESLSNKVIRLHCNHLFHRNCISSWFNIKIICPLCRNR